MRILAIDHGERRTGLALSDPIGHERPLRGENYLGPVLLMSSGGRLAVRAWENTVILYDLPAMHEPVPAWVADLAEALAGVRLGPNNVMEPLSPEQRALKIGTADDAWADVGRWILNPSRISFRSATTVREFVAASLADGRFESLEMAAQVAPGEPALFERMATHYREAGEAGLAEFYERRAKRLRN